MSTLWFVVILICVILSSVHGYWKFMILRSNWTSTNENALRTPLQPERISSGVYGLSGTIDLRVPMDNSFLFEMNVYRSASGSSKFVMTAYHMPKMPLDLLGKTFYNQYAVSTIKNCSDLPLVLKAPIQPKVYTFNKCMIDSRKMPNFVRPGFYNVVLKISSPLLVYVIEVVSQVYDNGN